MFCRQHGVPSRGDSRTTCHQCVVCAFWTCAHKHDQTRLVFSQCPHKVFPVHCEKWLTPTHLLHSIPCVFAGGSSCSGSALEQLVPVQDRLQNRFFLLRISTRTVSSCSRSVLEQFIPVSGLVLEQFLPVSISALGQFIPVSGSVLEQLLPVQDRL